MAIDKVREKIWEEDMGKDNGKDQVEIAID